MTTARFDIEREWAADDPRRQDLARAHAGGTDRRDAVVLGGDGAGDLVSVTIPRDLAEELRSWSAPAQIRVRAGSNGYELETRRPASSAAHWLRVQARKLERMATELEVAEHEQRGE